MTRVTALLLVLGVGTSQAKAEDALPLRPRHVNDAAWDSIQRGLKFLQRTQRKDEGSWRSAGRYGSYPASMTGLAGMALICSGSTPNRGPYARNVRKAAAYLLRIQQPNGLLAAPMEEGHSMYGHGFATLFLAQVYGMEEDLKRQRRIKAALKHAIKLIGRSQSVRGGWYYQPNSGADEGSVTVTQMQALRACRNAGLHVPKKVVDMAIQYIEKSQNPDGGISYSINSRGSRPAISAAACAVLYNAGVYDSKMADRCFKYSWRMCQPNGGGFGHWFYTHHYMAQATWQKSSMDGGKEFWEEYYPKLRSRLLAMQQGNGSWNGDGVGPIYGTALALTMLQLPFQHAPILSR